MIKKGLNTIKKLIIATVILSLVSIVGCGDEISDVIATLEDNTDNDLNKLLDGGTNILHNIKNFFVKVANDNMGITEKLNKVCDSTCLDELITQSGSNILNNLDTLCEYMTLSNNLNELNLEEIARIDTNVNSTLLSVEEIKELIKKYEENKNDSTILLELKNQEKIINNYIYQNGNSYIAELYDLLIRAKIADSYGFDTNISLSIANSIEIPNEDAMQYNTNNKVDSIAVGTNSVKLNREYKDMLENLYLASNNANYTNYSYNKDLNNEIESFMIDAVDYLDDSYRLKFK